MGSSEIFNTTFRKSLKAGFYMNGRHIGTAYHVSRTNGDNVYMYSTAENGGSFEIDLETVVFENEFGRIITPADLQQRAELLTSIVSADFDGRGTDITNVNGVYPGTLFGDNFTVTNRVPTLAAKWSQGILLKGFKFTDGANGYWEILADENDPTLFDGVSEIGIRAGAANNEKLIITTAQKNRYIPGHLSYFGNTIAINFDGANGDFEMFIGAINRGPESLSLHTEIKDGIIWGVKRVAGVDSFVVRTIKNYVIAHEDSLSDNFDYKNLNIFEQRIGYYGIHPAEIRLLLTEDNEQPMVTELFFKTYKQDRTSISDPNLSMGIYIKNNGNTGNIFVRNGSIEFGNYIVNVGTNDPASRDITHSVSIASIAADTDDTDLSGLIGAYTIPDIVNMVYKIESGVESFANFHNTIANRLHSFIAQGNVIANKPLKINIYLLEKDAVVLNAGQSFVQIRPGINVLSFADRTKIASVDFTAKIDSTIVRQINEIPTEFDVAGEGQDLTTDFVAVITLTSTQAVTVEDFEFTIITSDLF